MYFEDIKLNTVIKLAPTVIAKDKMIAFAKEYDNIPLHTNEEYAEKTSFGKLIAPGFMSFLEVWAKYLEVDLFNEELLAGKSTKIEWFKPVFADEILTSLAKVTALTKRNERNGIVELTISVYNKNGDLVLSSITEAIVKCKPNL